MQCSSQMTNSKKAPLPLTATDSWIHLVEKVIQITCQSASVFSRHNNDPVPLDCDCSSSTGQIGKICNSDYQDVAGSLRN